MTRALAAAAGLGVLAVALGAAGQPRAQTPASGSPAAPAKPAAKGDDKGQPVTVDADRMERYGKESLVIFTGNVVARQAASVQYADRMEVYLDEKSDKVVRTVSTGAVRIITKDCKTGTARRAEYFDLDQRMVLIGNARVWQDDNVVTGETITIFLAQDRSVAQGGKQERVKGIFYTRDEKNDQPSASPRPAGAAAKTASSCGN
ncbi:MAG: lipopolysaccharide transport periplasmic protein LptA [Candidatus Rokubacteria bacterium]|nr:lipopolysaccharide transport periplasmic protein LptA [Candidatus Rokubacteria bacterium]MBI3825835.1 lipopolysaccharide transport periplasmic protein LptA [Candidatus Rokubacteria bacterium]